MNIKNIIILFLLLTITTGIVSADIDAEDFGNISWVTEQIPLEGAYGKLINIDQDTNVMLVKTGNANSYGGTQSSDLILHISDGNMNYWNDEINLGNEDVRDIIWDGEKLVGIGITDDLIHPVTITLDGVLTKGNGKLSDSFPLANHGIVSNGTNIYAYYYENFDADSIRYYEIRNNEWYGSELQTGIIINSDDTYDFEMFDNNNHILYPDSGDTWISIDGQTTKIVNNFEPVDLMQDYSGNLIALVGRDVISDVDNIRHYEIYYSTSENGTIWSSPKQFSPDNGHSKNDVQVGRDKEGRYILFYEYQGQIWPQFSDLPYSIDIDYMTLDNESLLGISGTLHKFGTSYPDHNLTLSIAIDDDQNTEMVERYYVITAGNGEFTFEVDLSNYTEKAINVTISSDLTGILFEDYYDIQPPATPTDYLPVFIVILVIMAIPVMLFLGRVFAVNRRFSRDYDLEATHIPRTLLKEKKNYQKGIFKRIRWAFIVYKQYSQVIPEPQSELKPAMKPKIEEGIITVPNVGQVKNCCYQTARIGETYCVCGRAVSKELINHFG